MSANMGRITSDIQGFLERLNIELPVCVQCASLADEQMPEGLCSDCFREKYSNQSLTEDNKHYDSDEESRL